MDSLYPETENFKGKSYLVNINHKIFFYWKLLNNFIKLQINTLWGPIISEMNTHAVKKKLLINEPLLTPLNQSNLTRVTESPNIWYSFRFAIWAANAEYRIWESLKRFGHRIYSVTKLFRYSMIRFVNRIFENSVDRIYSVIRSIEYSMDRIGSMIRISFNPYIESTNIFVYILEPWAAVLSWWTRDCFHFCFQRDHIADYTCFLGYAIFNHFKDAAVSARNSFLLQGNFASTAYFPPHK